MNLFTLNFKKIPKAFGIALLIIIIIELCSYLILLKIKSVVENNDLIKMDSDPLCRNLSVYNTEPPKDIKYLPKETNMSIKQIGSLGPYDVVVFGNSVTITGWCEILRLDHKVKICDLSANKNFDIFTYPSVNFARILKNYKTLNISKKSILIFGTLTERAIFPKINFYEPESVYEKIMNNKDHADNSIDIKLPSIKLMNYFLTKNYYGKISMVKIIKLNSYVDLFYDPDLKGLDMNIQYNKTDYENICKSLRFFKETAKKYGSIFCIVVFPTKPQMYEWLINEKINRKNISTRSSLKIMKRAAKDTGIPFLDIEEELKPIAKELYYSSGNLLWRRCDTHMNDDGNKYTAVIMEKFLKKVRKESGID